MLYETLQSETGRRIIQQNADFSKQLNLEELCMWIITGAGSVVMTIATWIFAFKNSGKRAAAVCRKKTDGGK